MYFSITYSVFNSLQISGMWKEALFTRNSFSTSVNMRLNEEILRLKLKTGANRNDFMKQCQWAMEQVTANTVTTAAVQMPFMLVHALYSQQLNGVPLGKTLLLWMRKWQHGYYVVVSLYDGVSLFQSGHACRRPYMSVWLTVSTCWRLKTDFSRESATQITLPSLCK